MSIVDFVTSALLLTGMVFYVCSILDQRKRAAFAASFPPITDAEFLTRCAPGTNPDVALKVRRTVADALGVDYDRVYPTSRLIADLGAE